MLATSTNGSYKLGAVVDEGSIYDDSDPQVVNAEYHDKDDESRLKGVMVSEMKALVALVDDERADENTALAVGELESHMETLMEAMITVR